MTTKEILSQGKKDFWAFTVFSYFHGFLPFQAYTAENLLLHRIFFLFLYTASSGFSGDDDDPPSEYCDAYTVILYYCSFKFYILLSSRMPTTK